MPEICEFCGYATFVPCKSQRRADTCSGQKKRLRQFARDLAKLDRTTRGTIDARQGEG